VEDVLDALMPLLPQGVYQRELDGDRAEVAFYGDSLGGADLDALAGDALLAREEEDVVGRPRVGRAWEVGGRLRVRSPTDAPVADGLEEIVIEPGDGAFGTGAHPTTRMSLELLLELEPRGGFADLGCGAGVLAIAAARLGWAPVLAVDHEPQSVAAARRNAHANGAAVEVVEADLARIPPPPAPTLAANVPPAIHDAIAAGLPSAVRHLIASGFIASERDAVEAGYAAAGLAVAARRGDGWQALLLERRP
jgi:ribosomal protein L11 methyltransferase